jgi:signal transduction histidine kinase
MLHRVLLGGSGAAWLLAGLCWSQAALGDCIPLPSVELRTIDRYTDIEPGRAVSAANARLAAIKANDYLTRAQLQAIIADAALLASKPQDARDATVAAFAALSHVDANHTPRSLKQRLTLANISADMESGDNGIAIPRLDELLRGMPDNSLERSCVLEARGEAYSELNENDRAAADATAAYAIAEEGGWTNARVQAAHALGMIYGRAGLTLHAVAMIDEVSSLARAEHRKELLAIAEFTRGMILFEDREFAPALASFAITKATSEELHDLVGVAAAEFATCMTYIEQEDVASADRHCDVDDSKFVSSQRTDLLVSMQGVRAHLQLLHGHPAAALRIFDAILSQPTKALVPYLLPSFYKNRAAGFNALGDYAHAYQSLQEAAALEDTAFRAKRIQAVAVLGAAAAAEKLMTNNKALERQLAGEEAALANQYYIRSLWLGFLLAAGFLCVLLLGLLVIARRQGNRLRHNEATMLAYANNVPDALVLLDAGGLVRFANHNLFDPAGANHASGRPLSENIASAAQPSLTAVMEDIFVKRISVEHTAMVMVEGGQARYFGLYGSPVVDGGHFLGAILRTSDVTQMRQLEREVIDSSRRERQLLSSELHEGLGQVLTGVLLLLRSLLNHADKGLAIAREPIVEINDHIVNTLKSVREIARGLSPIEIERGSLPDALQRLAQESSRRFGIPVCVNALAPSAISNFAGEQLYHIASEAITNAARHGHCGRIDLMLAETGDVLELAITDDGVGMPGSAPGAEGFGTKLMTYYARLLGGHLQFERAASGGACVRVRVPAAHLKEPPGR